MGEMKTNTELTLREAIEIIEPFCPIKITFNGIELFNDYDDVDYSLEQFDKEKDFIDLLADRLWRFDDYLVTSLNIKIVQFHHAIVEMEGYMKERE